MIQATVFGPAIPIVVLMGLVISLWAIIDALSRPGALTPIAQMVTLAAFGPVWAYDHKSEERFHEGSR